MFQEASQKKDGDSPKRKAMEMLQEQPGHKEEEARSDVDDGDDCPSSDEFPIAASSATGQMPAGNLFRSVARIRNTANGYVQGLQSVGWYGALKLPTIQALRIRLKTMTSGSWLAHTVMCRLGTSNAWPG